MQIASNKLLSKIHKPDDLRKLDKADLPTLCNEIREYYIDLIASIGGHFAAGLGVVELTVALHYVFDTPHDRLIWDVGHQTYVHKMLTERKDLLKTLRQKDGLSGFPKISESRYDHFGTGHASTAISAALGYASGDALDGDHLKRNVAIVGDGALTGGLAFEGLNNAGVNRANLLIVFNDNAFSIDPAVGALSQQSATPAPGRPSEGIGDGRNKKSKSRNKAVNLSTKSFFESLNIRYFPPVDGHNVLALIDHLEAIKAEKGARLLHVKTIKGKGYEPAENDQAAWHSTGKFDKLTGKGIAGKESKSPMKFQDVFGLSLCELAEADKDIVGITAAMPSGTGLRHLMERYPDRTFDVGIAEAHAVTFSAALAAQGKKVVCALYSTFLQRAYDQLIHDVALQKLPVLFCIDRAGLVGRDGPTHHGSFDLAYLNCIPNLVVTAPSGAEELRNLMQSGIAYDEGPFAIRYPRGNTRETEWQTPFEKIQIGKARIVRKGKGIALLCMGHVLHNAIEAIDELGANVTVVDMRYMKPMDTKLLSGLLQNHQAFITVEDGCLEGGFGMKFNQWLSGQLGKYQHRNLGIPDEFIEQGSPEELYAQCGYDKEGIKNVLRKLEP